MSEQDPHINDLFHKYLQGKYTEQELDQLLDYFNLDRHDHQLSALIAQQFEKPVPEQVNKEAISTATRSMDTYVMKHTKPRRSSSSYYLWAGSIAASILVFITIGIYFYKKNDIKDAPQSVSAPDNDILPGGNRATITLEDGSIIALSEDQEGIIINDRMTYDDGSVVSDAASSFATMVTPRGGQYRVTLPDGSKVWLNAASSLRYPTKFNGGERIVELTGEAYFEVNRKENQPFIVHTEAQTLNVLGTAFNINAYSDEPFTATTLVSGSIRIQVADNEKAVTLKPGQQATTDATAIRVKQVDVQDYIAWRNEQISLNHADLPAVIRQIERWYDVEFDTGSIPQGEPVFGVLKRNAKLSEILEALELNYDITFRKEGRRIIIGK